jgi:hypothetical protein
VLPRSHPCHIEILDGRRSTKETPSLRKIHLGGVLKANGTVNQPFVSRFGEFGVFKRSINVGNRKF